VPRARAPSSGPRPPGVATRALANRAPARELVPRPPRGARLGDPAQAGVLPVDPKRVASTSTPRSGAHPWRLWHRCRPAPFEKESVPQANAPAPPSAWPDPPPFRPSALAAAGGPDGAAGRRGNRGRGTDGGGGAGVAGGGGGPVRPGPAGQALPVGRRRPPQLRPQAPRQGGPARARADPAPSGSAT
jgi:hypothetical protein